VARGRSSRLLARANEVIEQRRHFAAVYTSLFGT
jgi:hypothetical protein